MDSKEPQYFAFQEFEPVDYLQTITCRGAQITVWPPSNKRVYIRHKNLGENITFDVPVGHKVEVIDGYVALFPKNAQA